MTVLADLRPRRPSPATLGIGLTWMISSQVRDENEPPTLSLRAVPWNEHLVGSPGDAAWRNTYGAIPRKVV